MSFEKEAMQFKRKSDLYSSSESENSGNVDDHVFYRKPKQQTTKKPSNKNIPLSVLLPRINALSTPKWSKEVQQQPVLQTAFLNNSKNPSKRYISSASFEILSKPKSVVPKWSSPKPVEYISISDNILKHKPSAKTIALARPKSITPKFEVDKEDVRLSGGISRYVLNYKSTERIESLAQPKRRFMKLLD